MKQKKKLKHNIRIKNICVYVHLSKFISMKCINLFLDVQEGLTDRNSIIEDTYKQKNHKLTIN